MSDARSSITHAPTNSVCRCEKSIPCLYHAFFFLSSRANPNGDRGTRTDHQCEGTWPFQKRVFHGSSVTAARQWPAGGAHGRQTTSSRYSALTKVALRSALLRPVRAVGNASSSACINWLETSSQEKKGVCNGPVQRLRFSLCDPLHGEQKRRQYIFERLKVRDATFVDIGVDLVVVPQEEL